MRCPKCGYISFDYNHECPKCNKDVSTEVAKVGLPSYKPNPPSLLGALTGEANESNVGFELDPSSSLEITKDMGDVVLSDSSVLETDGVELEEAGVESVDFSHEDSTMDVDDDLELDLDDTGELEEESLEIDEPLATESELDDTGELEDDSLEIDEPLAMESELDDSEELALDEPDDSQETVEPTLIEPDQGDSLEFELDDSIEGLDEQPTPAEPQQEDSMEINLDDIAIDEDELAKLEVDEEETLSIDQAAAQEKIKAAKDDDSDLGESSMIELDLDDLKINKTGQLEIKEQAQFSEGLKQAAKSKKKVTDETATKIDQEIDKVKLDLDDDDDIPMDIEKLDLEIDIEKPEDKIL